MAKILKVAFPEKCIKCELCIMEAQKQLGKVGLEGSLIRVLRKTDSDRMSFSITLDQRINDLDIQKIKDICPTGVFSIEEEKNEYGLLG